MSADQTDNALIGRAARAGLTAAPGTGAYWRIRVHEGWPSIRLDLLLDIVRRLEVATTDSEAHESAFETVAER